MKQILKYIMALAALALIVPSCSPDFEWDGFGVNNDDTEEHCINLKATDEGTTSISVYTNSSWWAEFENEVDWATLSNTSGVGTGRINFEYNANHQALRRAFILVHCQGETRRIMVVQAGENIVFRFRAEDGEMFIEKDATTYYLALDSNISKDLYKNVVLDEVVYTSLSKDWIKNVRMSGEQLLIDVATNETGVDRTARLGITFTDPYTKTIYGPSYVNITQGVTSSIEISWDTLLERYEANKDASGNWVIVGESEEELQKGVKISATNLSFAGNSNAAMNAASSWSGNAFAAQDTNINDATTYLNSRDHKYSMMMRMASGKDNMIPQFAIVQVRVDGCTLRKLADGRLTLTNVRSRNIVSLTSATESEIQPIERTLSELTPADYYRIVTIKDVELVYNKGALYNTTDGYRHCCDYYPTLLRDKDGNTIYMMFNHKQALEWVRQGKEAPLGKGNVKGILTYETSPRYGQNSGEEYNNGGSLGKYVIRPYNESCLMFNYDEENSFSVTHTEWHWLDSKITFDEANRGVISKTGNGIVYHELGTVPAIGTSFSGLTAGTSATVTNINTACNFNSYWMSEDGAYKGLIFEFSATTLGSGASLNLAYWAGSQSTGGTGLNTPANWHIQYSLDGVSYTTVEGSEVDIHPAVWWTSTCPTFGVAGLAQHTVLLPAEISGQEKVYLRFAPMTSRCASSTYPEGAEFNHTNKIPLCLTAATIKYNK